MLIERPPEWFRSLFPGVIFRLPAPAYAQQRVFLTFDDGPIPDVTPWVLDCLDKYDVKATFFMVGQNVERNPLLLKEVTDRGHHLGNHTLHHIRGIGISADKYLQDAIECEKLTYSQLFRPPHGWLTPSQLKAVKARYKVIMYDLVTRDYSKRLTANDVVNNVKRYVRNGSIIVFHDSLKSISRIKSALPQSVEWLLDRGYKFELL